MFNTNDLYFIAEIGANHNGDINLAKQHIDSAKEAGCHCAKFQSWQVDSICSETEFSNNTVYTDDPKKHFGSLKEMAKEYFLSFDEQRELSTYCKSKGIQFASTPFSLNEVDLLVELDVPFIKIASMDITNYDLLEYSAKSQKPIILSTGMATIQEIGTAVDLIRTFNNTSLKLLHCTSIYPPKEEDINLHNINMLNQAFGCDVGYSDHTIGNEVSFAAITLGAKIIEKHFTLDKTLPGWDHAISANPNEMRQLIHGCKKIQRSLGSRMRVINSAEIEKKAKFRRSCCYTADLPEGTQIEAHHITGKRPGSGIPIEKKTQFIGRSLKFSVTYDQLLTETDFK